MTVLLGLIAYVAGSASLTVLGRVWTVLVPVAGLATAPTRTVAVLSSMFSGKTDLTDTIAGPFFCCETFVLGASATCGWVTLLTPINLNSDQSCLDVVNVGCGSASSFGT